MMIGNAPCMHIDSESCNKCFGAIRLTETVNTIDLNLELFRKNGEIDFYLVGVTSRMEKFGITNFQFHELCEDIQKSINKIFNQKPE